MLTALRYVNEILDVYVRPYAGAVGENFILMDDNSRAHRARITDQYLEQATIVRMEWPARSPDLNPIEHAWDMLQTAVSSRPVQPASVQELRQAVLEEWDQIPQYKIRRLICSMQRPKSNRACLGYVTDSCFITPRATSICTGAQTGSS